MEKKKLESEFVRLTMSDASAAEIEEATRRWFCFLGTIKNMVERLEREERCHIWGEVLPASKSEEGR